MHPDEDACAALVIDSSPIRPDDSFCSCHAYSNICLPQWQFSRTGHIAAACAARSAAAIRRGDGCCGTAAVNILRTDLRSRRAAAGSGRRRTATGQNGKRAVLLALEVFLHRETVTGCLLGILLVASRAGGGK